MSTSNSTQWNEMELLRAENERLNGVVERAKQAYKAWEEVAHEKEAENERLRAFVGRVVSAYAVDEWIAEEGQRLLDEPKRA